MIDQSRVDTVSAGRDERSMRVVEYAMAFLALAAAVLLSFH